MTIEPEPSMQELAREVARLRAEVDRLRNPPDMTEAYQRHPFVTMGEGAKVAAGARIMAENEGRRVILGKHARLYRGTEVLGPVTMGDYSFVNRDGYIRAEVTIGQRVSIGPFVQLVTDNHDLGPTSQRAGRFHAVPITVGDGVWIGAGAIVIGGVSIGEGAVVAAGAVVVHDVPPNTVVAGVPARVVRDLEAPLAVMEEASGASPVERPWRRRWR